MTEQANQNTPKQAENKKFHPLTAQERKSFLKNGERLDELHRNGYYLIQNPDLFCFGMDAVLLSGFARMKPGERALDLGTGNGIIPILLEAKTPGQSFTGLEIQAENADMARRSVKLNGLEGKISIVEGDIRNASGIFGASSFEVVTCNPPYIPADRGVGNESRARALARHEILCTLEDCIREAARILPPGGRLYLVHRPFRLTEILARMAQHRIEPKRMRMVYPYADREPNLVLLEGRKDAGPEMTVEKPLILFREPGVYTEEIYEIYGY